MTRVLKLTDPRAQDVGLVGPPMATLARLAAAGLPVPPGFVVTTECGEWADPEAEAAVYRAYYALGDGHGGLPTVCAVASPPGMEDLSLGAESRALRHSASTVSELLAAIDTCRGGPTSDGERPYYPGPPATFVAVGVLKLDTAAPAGAVAVRLSGQQGAYETKPLWSTSSAPVDDAVHLAALDLCRRVGEVLGGEAVVEWAVVDGAPAVVRARILTSGEEPFVLTSANA